VAQRLPLLAKLPRPAYNSGMQMARHRRVAVVAVLAAASVPAATALWSTTPARAALGQSAVAGTVSCATYEGSLQISAYAYRPSVGYAGAFIFTGFPNTPATIHLLGLQTTTSKLTLDSRCSTTKKSVRLAHHGLNSAGVVKAGYDQSLTAYCGAPARVFVRYRIGYASSGKPATATIAIWAKRKKSSQVHQIGYVQWSRSRSTTYYAKKSCVAQS
jgi:hypothetical protein